MYSLLHLILFDRLMSILGDMVYSTAKAKRKNKYEKEDYEYKLALEYLLDFQLVYPFIWQCPFHVILGSK